jgi:hypothetical protein
MYEQGEKTRPFSVSRLFLESKGLCGYDTLMEEFIIKLPWAIIIIICLTLGLAPYNPPHIVEKITMLVQGRLVRPIDWFDLAMHSVPWILLILKLLYTRK